MSQLKNLRIQKKINKIKYKKKEKKVVRYFPQLMASQTIRVETVFAINMVPPDVSLFDLYRFLHDTPKFYQFLNESSRGNVDID